MISCLWNAEGQKVDEVEDIKVAETPHVMKRVMPYLLIYSSFTNTLSKTAYSYVKKDGGHQI
jgi:hypothetical protein